MIQERAKAITNIIVAIVLLANAILTAAGKNPLPFNEDSTALVISSILAGIDTVWVWWKNQNLTAEAVTGQKVTAEMKADREAIGGEDNPLGDERGQDHDWD